MEKAVSIVGSVHSEFCCLDTLSFEESTVSVIQKKTGNLLHTINYCLLIAQIGKPQLVNVNVARTMVANSTFILDVKRA